jgi:hypothetical protein
MEYITRSCQLSAAQPSAGRLNEALARKLITGGFLVWLIAERLIADS